MYDTYMPAISILNYHIQYIVGQIMLHSDTGFRPPVPYNPYRLTYF